MNKKYHKMPFNENASSRDRGLEMPLLWRLADVMFYITLTQKFLRHERHLEVIVFLHDVSSIIIQFKCYKRAFSQVDSLMLKDTRCSSVKSSHRQVRHTWLFHQPVNYSFTLCALKKSSAPKFSITEEDLLEILRALMENNEQVLTRLVVFSFNYPSGLSFS